MALQPTITVTAQIIGGIGGVDSIMETMAAPPNTNGPPPSAASLQAGINTIQVPDSGFVVSVCVAKPPTGSTNAKTLMGDPGDIGLSGWTAAPVIVPVVAGGTFVIASAGQETLELIWG